MLKTPPSETALYSEPLYIINTRRTRQPVLLLSLKLAQFQILVSDPLHTKARGRVRGLVANMLLPVFWKYSTQYIQQLFNKC